MKSPTLASQEWGTLKVKPLLKAGAPGTLKFKPLLKAGAIGLFSIFVSRLVTYDLCTIALIYREFDSVYTRRMGDIYEEFDDCNDFGVKRCAG